MCHRHTAALDGSDRPDIPDRPADKNNLCRSGANLAPCISRAVAQKPLIWRLVPWIWPVGVFFFGVGVGVESTQHTLVLDW